MKPTFVLVLLVLLLDSGCNSDNHARVKPSATATASTSVTRPTADLEEVEIVAVVESLLFHTRYHHPDPSDPSPSVIPIVLLSIESSSVLGPKKIVIGFDQYPDQPIPGPLGKVGRHVTFRMRLDHFRAAERKASGIGEYGLIYDGALIEVR